MLQHTPQSCDCFWGAWNRLAFMTSCNVLWSRGHYLGHFWPSFQQKRGLIWKNGFTWWKQVSLNDPMIFLMAPYNGDKNTDKIRSSDMVTRIMTATIYDQICSINLGCKLRTTFIGLLWQDYCRRKVGKLQQFSLWRNDLVKLTELAEMNKLTSLIIDDWIPLMDF